MVINLIIKNKKLDNKIEFNNAFSGFLGRKWIDMANADINSFSEFISGLDTIISKPVEEACGRGVEKISVLDYASPEELFNHLREKNSGLCEECVVQH